MNPEAERAPWERQPGEPTRAYAAFCLYRDMPASERSLRAVAGRLYGPNRTTKVPKTLARWSARWRWVERAAAWDEEQDRRAREAQLKAIQEMRERHAREAMALQQKALQRLKDMDPNELSPEAVLRYFVEAAKLERVSRGEPETIQEQRHDWVSAVLELWSKRQAQTRPEEAEGDGA